MKSLISLLALLAVLACFALFSVTTVQGLSQNGITLSFDWSKSIYYQGDSGSVTISLYSTCGNELEFTWVGIHFAWMQENYYYILDLSSNPIKIPSGGSCTFSAIGFSVSSTASVGWNEYYVRIDYNEHHWYGWASGTWTSSTHQIYIHDYYEEIYNELRPKVLSAINEAQRANYESPDAKSLLSQAINEYNIAVSLANQENWKDAVSHLQTASNLLDQASAREEEYHRQEEQEELGTWRQTALDSINIATQKIEQLKGCESLDAESILEQAQIQLTNAQNSFNRATLEGYQDAYDYALRASSYADEAAIREQEYQQNKQITSELIGRAEEKIDQIKNVESVEAKGLLQKALDELKRAKDAYNQKTIIGCINARPYAQQSITHAEQAFSKEQEYQREKQNAFSVIAIAEEKIGQVKDVESTEAKQLLQQAQSELAGAMNAYDQKTIEGCKTACSIAQQAIAYAEQASDKEQGYQQERQNAFGIIETAEEKIGQVKDVESTEAKQLLQQAQSELAGAMNAYDQKTIEGCKTACSIAQQAIAYAEQAYAKEQTYQQQKQRQQQQLILIGGGISAIVIAIVGVVLMRRKRKPVTTTQT